MVDEKQIDLAETACSGAVLAGVAYIIYSIRSYGSSRKFDVVGFFVGLASSGLVGALVALALDGYNISPEFSAVITAMAGYCGGTLLDMYYGVVRTVERGLNKEVADTLHAAGDAARERLKGNRNGTTFKADRKDDSR